MSRPENLGPSFSPVDSEPIAIRIKLPQSILLSGIGPKFQTKKSPFTLCFITVRYKTHRITYTGQERSVELGIMSDLFERAQKGSLSIFIFTVCPRRGMRVSAPATASLARESATTVPYTNTTARKSCR